MQKTLSNTLVMLQANKISVLGGRCNLPLRLNSCGARGRKQLVVCNEAPKPQVQNISDRCVSPIFNQTVTAAAAAALSLTLVLGAPALAQPTLPSTTSETQILRLPASANPGVFAAQQTLVEAWTIVGESFVDDSFNGLNWASELKQHMGAAYNAADPELAEKQIDEMLLQLGDPYTRHITPEQYQKFRVSSDGELQGVGLLIASQMSETGHLLVLAPIKGGPADRAGILPGDEVVTINGHQTEGLSGDQAAQLLRGKGGTEVRVTLSRRTEGIPGVAGTPEAKPQILMKEVSLKRERVSLSPLYYTALSEMTEGGGQKNVGYLRLTQFSNNAADDMRAAIQDLEARGVDEYILDLRSNPGGLVSAGIDVASLWLDGEKPVFNIQGREGATLVQTTQTARLAVTHDPLVVLVNEDSASASEILSGALRDNHRALIVGDKPTFGKGRIQTVYELHDGSALFVTVAKYQTPSGSEIDMRGIRPDRSCRPQRRHTLQMMSASNRLPPAPPLSAPKVMRVPPGFTRGLPMGVEMEQALVAQLQEDSCVLAAEEILDRQVELPSLSAMLPSARMATVAAIR